MEPEFPYSQEEIEFLLTRGLSHEDFRMTRRLKNLANPLHDPNVAAFFDANPVSDQFELFSLQGPFSNPSPLEIRLLVPFLIQVDSNDPNTILNEHQQTLLHHVVDRGYSNSVEYLIELPQMNVNARDVRGNTPLHYAIINRNEMMINLLLQRDDLDLSTKNDGNESALSLIEKDKKLQDFTFRFIEHNSEYLKKINQQRVPIALEYVSGTPGMIGFPMKRTPAMNTGAIKRVEQSKNNPRVKKIVSSLVKKISNSLVLTYLAGLITFIATCTAKPYLERLLYKFWNTGKRDAHTSANPNVKEKDYSLL